jgi:hypothetical protein
MQRFYEHGGESQVTADAPLQPSMDIFSLGYVHIHFNFSPCSLRASFVSGLTSSPGMTVYPFLVK